MLWSYFKVLDHDSGTKIEEFYENQQSNFGWKPKAVILENMNE